MGPALGNKAVLAELKRRLEARGVVVTVQPAITTTSIYITFDYGVLKKARIGDHKGKAYAYTYEIGQHIREYQEVQASYLSKPYTRYKFPAANVGDLVQEILIARSNMWSKYGKDGYQRILDREKAK